MLTRKENSVMGAVYELCDGTESCLVSAADILSLLPKKYACTADGLDTVLYGLHCDGYFDLITSERKGERMYVITLRESGFAFKRGQAQRRREVLFKVALAFVGAFATFIFGLILRGLFG